MHRNSVSEQIKNFIVGHFPLARRRNITADDRLLESGIVDSLGVLDLVTYIETTFKVGVTDEELLPEHFQTINDLTTFVQKKLDASTD